MNAAGCSDRAGGAVLLARGPRRAEGRDGAGRRDRTAAAAMLRADAATAFPAHPAVS
jgi:hypothetical protein